MAKVVVYSADYCPYCKRAKALLQYKGVEFEEIVIKPEEETEIFAKLYEMTGGRQTIPQIFIDGKSVGGFTDIKALDDAGELDKLLNE